MNLSWFSNPIWRLRDLFLHHGQLAPGTLWKFDSYGYASSSDNRTLSPAEVNYLNQYNYERASLNAASQATIDNLMRSLSPVSDSTLTTGNPAQDVLDEINKQLDWLADHANGSDFYADWGNYEYYTGADPDAEADYRLGSLAWYLDSIGLDMDLTELQEKVWSGVASPIAIDLNGDGIKTTSLFVNGGVMFDIDGDGVKDRTAWLTGGDAFLAVDKDGNGSIDGVSELFGGPDRGDGFANLAQYDSNADGFVDQNDDDFAKLLLWSDLNMDGMTNAGELQGAADAGLQSISTNYLSQEVYSNGNLLGEVSTAMINGSAVDATDIYFRYKKGAGESDAAAAAATEFLSGTSGGDEVRAVAVGEIGSMSSALMAALATFSVPGTVEVHTVAPINLSSERFAVMPA